MSKVLTKAANISRRRSVKSISSASSSNSLTTLADNSNLASPKRISETQKPNTMNSKRSLEEERLVKTYLKQYKRLEVALVKFDSKAKGVKNTNILRTTILVFLRSNKSVSDKLLGNPRMCRSLQSVLLTILIKWWSCLLASLTSSQSQISPTNRNAYLECISRIISRKEWFNADRDIMAQYSDLLISTLDYSINKLQTLKVVPLAMSAFVGKVFAYSYFAIPRICDALLFLLNVKQSVFESNLRMKPSNVSQEGINYLYSAFPKHLHHLIDFKGLSSLPKNEKMFINCVRPPQHPVKGIKEPSGTWVRRWCATDSDLFNSFFRHYIAVLQFHLGDSAIDSRLLLNCPGLSILLSHIHRVIDISFTRIAEESLNKPGNDLSTPIMGKTLAKIPRQSSSPFQSVSQPSTPPTNVQSRPLNSQKKNDVYHNSLIKIFKILRDIKYCSTILFDGVLIELIDLSFINIAKKISIYDYNKNSLILNIVYEFIMHVESSVNWEFWLSCNYIMLNKTDHIQTLLKNFAFFFNIWDKIPDVLSRSLEDGPHMKWLNDRSLTYKLNMVNWLISNDTFERFLTHWNPIVRSYYLRLIVWRVVGINNFESSSSILITRRVEKKFLASHSRLVENASKIKLDSLIESPMVNRKFGILPVSAKDDYLLLSGEPKSPPIPASSRSSEMRKTHPFEVFDEAIYMCSSLPSSPDQKKDDTDSSSRSNSLVNSIGKLFRILSSENSPKSHDRRKPVVKGSSSSLTSLSTGYSMKSRSSSPSVMSFNSTPTSLTEFSMNSSSDSEISSNTEMLMSQPPELFKIPPDPARPIFKFEIIMDNITFSNKFAIVDSTRPFSNEFSRITSRNSMTDLPSNPKIPSISVYLNTDSNGNLYLSCEDCEIEYGDLDLDNRTSCLDKMVFNNLSLSQHTKWSTLGRSLIEFNNIVDEYRCYVQQRVEIDKFDLQAKSLSDFDDYFQKIIPFLTADNLNEEKFFNAG